MSTRRLVLATLLLASGACKAELVVVGNQGVDSTRYALGTVDNVPLPAPVCASGNTCGTIIQTGSLMTIGTTMAETEERFGPSATSTDSMIRLQLACRCDPAFVLIEHGLGGPVDSGFIRSGVLQLFTWRGPRRHEFVYQRSP